jgi:ZPR1 zinc-finger domain
MVIDQSNVKTGGEVAEKAGMITVEVNTAEDLSRDILKSEFCAMSCTVKSWTSQLSLDIRRPTNPGPRRLEGNHLRH